MELQPAEMSTKKAARGTYLRASSGMCHAPFRSARGFVPSIAGACRKRSRQRGQAAWTGMGGKAWPLRKRLERCPGMPGLGTPPPCRAGTRWGPQGLTGKPAGSATASHQAGPKQPHVQPPHLLGEGHLAAWCCAHLQKPDFLPGSLCSRGRARASQPLQ